MKIHGPLCCSPNLGGFDQSNLNFFTRRSEAIQLGHLGGLCFDFREQRVKRRGFGRHRQFVVYRAPIVAFSAPVGANLKDLLCHYSHIEIGKCLAANVRGHRNVSGPAIWLFSPDSSSAMTLTLLFQVTLSI